MCSPLASASTSSGCAYSRSIRSRTRRSRARSRRCCAVAGEPVMSGIVPRRAVTMSRSPPTSSLLERTEPRAAVELGDDSFAARSLAEEPDAPRIALRAAGEPAIGQRQELVFALIVGRRARPLDRQYALAEQHSQRRRPWIV